MKTHRVLTQEEIARIGQQVAKVLQAKREALGLSKNALAQKAGVSVQSVSFIEEGVNSPSLSTFVRLCDALGASPENVFREAMRNK